MHLKESKIEFCKHNIDEKDIERATEVLRSVFLTTGKITEDFEKKMSSYLAVERVIGVTSCTAALHLSLIAWGIGPGDDVITTPMSFCATANTILHVGATPVFVDVEREMGNINADLIESKITENTKAIIPVHLYGHMCDMRKIRKISDKYGLVIIDDAAHAIEAERDGIKVGWLSDAACFSFYATKNITSGEGGAIATNNREKGRILEMLRLHGMDKTAIDRYTKIYQHYDMPILGWKYNMDNIHAALLIGQLDRIDKLWERRRYLYKIYEERLSGLKGITLLKTLSGTKHAYHLFTILVDAKRRDYILLKLQEMGIGVAVNYNPIHLLKYYREKFGYKEDDFPIAEEIGKRTITLPLYPSLTEEDLIYVVSKVKEIVQ